MKRNGNKSTALSPEALACYLPLNRGRAKTGYEQEVIQRLMDICRLFRAGSRKYEHDKVFRFSVRPPENQDADWWRLVLFSAEICRCRYALRKTGTAGEPYIEVCFTGKGRQAELSAELLGFIWSRYYQSRRRAWRKYMRTMRQKAGAEVLLSNKARELWHRNYVLQWILTLWQAFNNTGGCNGDSISTGRESSADRTGDGNKKRKSAAL
ncbi:hypothetical protein BG257_08260 [Proteus mirabilis]|uniref:Uncharacterized protein n=2 Tax=Gammaproteobacteria TaxID=1236 RepID=A0AAN1BZ83_PROMI|nr:MULTISPECIES: hypothetical protein [Morganellaceae]APG51133.1 hypothetical protein BGK56_09350 [Providencia stuartii]EMP52861.1 hypothetical protein C790_03463 [Morganella morganii SC01]OFV20007.1 hypothetical protein HMPREF3129_06515 [Proteus sp. HMSC14B05]ORD20697.1 hypothetical protein A4T38_17885 [Escherichia coli]PCO29631.1 hypothetical protein CP987_03060 [Morganella morganii]PLE31222.1 hypothetical protein B6I70_20635 [Klebsiella pneumoniae]